MQKYAKGCLEVLHRLFKPMDVMNRNRIKSDVNSYRFPTLCNQVKFISVSGYEPAAFVF